MEALDGNGAAGMLSEVFAVEVTSMRGRCDSCGNVAPLGEAVAYMDAPGLVVRCRTCDSVLLVLVRGDDHRRLTVSGITWFQLGA
jgi:Family of unknown function (DUF6510)